MDISSCELATTVMRRFGEMCRRAIAQDIEGFFIMISFDVTMRGKVLACWATFDQVVVDKNRMGARIVSIVKVDVRKAGGVRVAFCNCASVSK